MVCVSVIIPVYNRLVFCKTALDMLRAQTLKQIEFIIIDDGSTDGSYEWLCKNTAGDKRFVILAQDKNMGPSAARNRAIKIARGEYIGFFDIDDEIPANYFDLLYKVTKKSGADIGFASYNNLPHKKEGVVTSLQEKFALLRTSVIWDKLFKKSLILDNNIELPVGLYCADNVFTFESFYHAKSVVLSNSPMYTYVVSNDSISFDSKKKEKRKHDIIVIVNIMADFAKKHKVSNEENTIIYEFIMKFLNLYPEDKVFQTKLRNVLKKSWPDLVNKKKGCSIMSKIRNKIRRMKRFGGLSKHEYRAIKKSGLFSKKWYLKNYPDVAQAGVNPICHYYEFGWKEGRNPSRKFNTSTYLRDYPDVAKASYCPLLHYIECGRAEGRLIRSVDGNKNKVNIVSVLRSALTYPIRVRDEYLSICYEINRLKNK